MSNKKTSFYIEEYLKTKLHFRSYSTLKKRTTYFKEVFNNRDIDSITKDEMREWALTLLKGRKSVTVRVFINVAKAIFNIALENKIIKINPVHGIFLPRDIKIRIEPFTKEEVKKILEKIDKTSWVYPYLTIGFNTGMRTGEIIGLQWKDIDLDNLTISIQRNLSGGKLTPCKTPSSIREIPLPKIILPALEQLMYKNNSNWLFPNPQGEHMYGSQNAHNVWKRTLKKCGIKYRRLYEMRHTFASHMILENIPLMHLSKILGHSNIHTTLNIYARQVQGEYLKISRDIELY